MQNTAIYVQTYKRKLNNLNCKKTVHETLTATEIYEK